MSINQDPAGGGDRRKKGGQEVKHSLGFLFLIVFVCESLRFLFPFMTRAASIFSRTNRGVSIQMTGSRTKKNLPPPNVSVADVRTGKICSFLFFNIHFYDGWMEATDRDRSMSKKGRVQLDILYTRFYPTHTHMADTKQQSFRQEELQTHPGCPLLSILLANSTS